MTILFFYSSYKISLYIYKFNDVFFLSGIIAIFNFFTKPYYFDIAIGTRLKKSADCGRHDNFIENWVLNFICCHWKYFFFFIVVKNWRLANEMCRNSRNFGNKLHWPILLPFCRLLYARSTVFRMKYDVLVHKFFVYISQPLITEY